MVLNELGEWPKSHYDSQINNIVTEFFIPSLKNSTTYRRIGGLFNSTSLALASRGINELIKNGGKMQLIISPILTSEDAEILDSCTGDERNELMHKSLINNLDLKTEFEQNHVAALGYLLKEGLLEIKIDLQTDENERPLSYDEIIRNNRLDEKLGIFQDRNGSVISFRGPVNESKQSWEHGIFSITVDVDWISGQKQHILDDIARFERIWYSSKTLDLPNQTKSHLIKNSINKSKIHLEKFDVPEWAVLPDGNILWPHQIRAVNSWIKSNFRGIVNMATSGGKTLAALTSIRITPIESITLILVPTRVLVKQWQKSILDFDPNVDLVICTSEHPNWNTILTGKIEKYIGSNKVDQNRQIIILATMSSASSDKFMNHFEDISSEFLTVISDEVHHLGASKYSKIFGINTRRRLGLSATFERDWDEIGTQKIIEYFGNPFEDTYTISDGIREGKLSRYKYLPFFAYLNNDEFNDYADLTDIIGKLFAQIQSTKDPTKKITLTKKYERYLMNRAEILKNAEDKPRVYMDILESKPSKPFIVFADDREQIEKIRKIHKTTIAKLNRKNPNHFEKDDIMIFSGESTDSQREKILQESKQNQIPIFAMYCLDEGVDVPEFQSAILLSSSTSKRQYIQRRGRILRISKKNRVAQLYDIIVIPDPELDYPDMEIIHKIINKEKNRITELSKDALNKWDVYRKINDKLKELGYD